jgi:hypothetical protein
VAGEGYVAEAIDVSAAVVAAERVTVVPEILAIVVLAGIPVPVMAIPGTKPATSAADMVSVREPEAAVAAAFVKSAEVNATLVPAIEFTAVAKLVAVVPLDATVENVPFLPLKLKLTSFVVEFPAKVN